MHSATSEDRTCRLAYLLSLSRAGLRTGSARRYTNRGDSCECRDNEGPQKAAHRKLQAVAECRSIKYTNWNGKRISGHIDSAINSVARRRTQGRPKCPVVAEKSSNTC